MNTNSSIPKKVKQSDKTATSSVKRNFIMMTPEDALWVSQQQNCVKTLYLQALFSDPFGSRWMPLQTTLKKSALSEAKKALADRGLFAFKPDKSIRDGRATIGWLVRNLQGSRIDSFWKAESANAEVKTENVEPKSVNKEIESANADCILDKTLSVQDFQSITTSSQYSSSTPQGVDEKKDNSLVDTQPLEGVAIDYHKVAQQQVEALKEKRRGRYFK